MFFNSQVRTEISNSTGAAAVPWRFLLLSSLAVAAGGCGAPVPDGGTTSGKQAILDSVDIALTTENCSAAVNSITGLYTSSNTDNIVRLRAASAYGCNAKVNLFQLVGDISTNSGQLGGAGFWQVMTKLFPSTAGQDYVVEGSVLATDALQSALNPGALVLPANQVNAGSYNVGSMFSSDRIPDANLYMVFIGMAGIGGIQNRFGAPDPVTYKKAHDLPWTRANLMDTNGCMYASTLLNFIDAVAISTTYVSGNLSTSLGTMQSTFGSLLDGACQVGCTGVVPPVSAPANPRGNWVTSGCSMPAGSCSTCPIQLRDRTKCAKLTTDAVSCAAAGIVNFVNASDLGWIGP